APVGGLGVCGAGGGLAERGPVFGFGDRAAFVAVLFTAAADVGPRAVRLGVGGRLVVLVTEAALDHPVGGPVRMVCVVAAPVARDIGVVRVDQLAFGAERDVSVIGAVHGFFRAGRAFRSPRLEAIFDSRRRQQEVLVREVGGKALGLDEFRELFLDLFVGQAFRGLFASVRGVGIGVDEGPAEVGAVVR